MICDFAVLSGPIKVLIGGPFRMLIDNFKQNRSKLMSIARQEDDMRAEILSVVQIHTRIASYKKELRTLEEQLISLEKERSPAEYKLYQYRRGESTMTGQENYELSVKSVELLSQIDAVKARIAALPLLITKTSDCLEVAKAREDAEYKKALIEATAKAQAETTSQLFARLVALNPVLQDPPTYSAPTGEENASPALASVSSSEAVANSPDELLKNFKNEFNEQLAKKLGDDTLSEWNKKIDTLAFQLKKFKPSASTAAVSAAQTRAAEFKRSTTQADTHVTTRSAATLATV